jgi:hypothetical protein
LMKLSGETAFGVLITLLELPVLCVAVISPPCDLQSRSSMRAAKRRSRAAESPSPTTTTLRRGPYVRGGSRSASASCPRPSSIFTERARALGFLLLHARDRALDVLRWHCMCVRMICTGASLLGSHVQLHAHPDAHAIACVCMPMCIRIPFSGLHPAACMHIAHSRVITFICPGMVACASTCESTRWCVCMCICHSSALSCSFGLACACVFVLHAHMHVHAHSYLHPLSCFYHDAWISSSGCANGRGCSLLSLTWLCGSASRPAAPPS